jgi:hypothetical protein
VCVCGVCLQPVLRLCMSVYKSFCSAPGCVFIQEPVLHLCFLSTRALCCTCACLSTRAYVLHLHGCVCLQEPVLHLCVPVCKSFVLHLDVSVYKSLCSTCPCLSTRACAPPARVCLQELCPAPGHVCLQEPSRRFTCRCTYSLQIFPVCFDFFENRYVCFGCFGTCSKHRNKPKFFSFRESDWKTTETDLVSVLFSSNRKYFLFVSRTL